MCGDTVPDARCGRRFRCGSSVDGGVVVPGVEDGGELKREVDFVRGVRRKFTALGTDRTRRCGFEDGKFDITDWKYRTRKVRGSLGKVFERKEKALGRPRSLLGVIGGGSGSLRTDGRDIPVSI